MRNNAHRTFFVNATVWIGIIAWLYYMLAPSLPRFFSRGYTDDVYKSLEHAYNTSQYRIKEHPGIIPDETVFSYTAGAYVHGIDPIMINSEHAPLGKYFLALSIILFQNDALPILIFGLVSLIGLWQLSQKIIGRSFWAFIPVIILSLDRLFLDQFRTVPLLDLMQLPFIIYTVYAYITERENGKRLYWRTGILLGVVAAMKHPAMGALLYASFILSLYGSKQWIKEIISLTVWTTLGGIVYIATYIRTFMSGYSVADFIGFQKWIVLYQKSKFLYPFSVWKLIFLNQWQTWWGDFSLAKAADWNILWPLGTGTTIIYGLVGIMRRVKISLPEKILFSWILVYGAFLSTGVVSSRFLLPFLPFVYILSVRAIKNFILKTK